MPKIDSSIKSLEEAFKNSSAEQRNGERLKEFKFKQKIKRIIRLIMGIIICISLAALYYQTSCNTCGNIIQLFYAIIGGFAALYLSLIEV